MSAPAPAVAVVTSALLRLASAYTFYYPSKTPIAVVLFMTVPLEELECHR